MLLVEYFIFGLRGKKNINKYNAIPELIWRTLQLIVKTNLEDSVNDKNGELYEICHSAIEAKCWDRHGQGMCRIVSTCVTFSLCK